MWMGVGATPLGGSGTGFWGVAGGTAADPTFSLFSFNGVACGKCAASCECGSRNSFRDSCAAGGFGGVFDAVERAPADGVEGTGFGGFVFGRVTTTVRSSSVA